MKIINIIKTILIAIEKRCSECASNQQENKGHKEEDDAVVLMTMGLF